MSITYARCEEGLSPTKVSLSRSDGTQEQEDRSSITNLYRCHVLLHAKAAPNDKAI